MAGMKWDSMQRTGDMNTVYWGHVILLRSPAPLHFGLDILLSKDMKPNMIEIELLPLTTEKIPSIPYPTGWPVEYPSSLKCIEHET
jgi:hypothetical protein